ncbi:MAG: metabolite traffic protein EboE [Verrucomicrobiaceae bacterium]|nr:metabolite traffic protein EboE [Verrucomicrobiaceae bacterium]
MHLNHDIHLGYCTNIHRGESWDETWKRLDVHTLEVRRRVLPQDKPYGIGLRLGNQAARELAASPCQLAEFQEWLEKNNCYVFTINGFPYGAFHGTRVKEQVFKPDWATQERLDYTCLLFDLLAKLLPKGMSGSVSTLPGSHKTFNVGSEEISQIFSNLKICKEHIARISEETGHDLHLGLEPEPLGLFETSGETIKFFGLYLDQYPQDTEFLRFVGMNYDTCHLAIEYEEAASSLKRIQDHGIRISKLHFSNALRLTPTPENLQRLAQFNEPVYFHQVIVRDGNNPLRRFADLDLALEAVATDPKIAGDEWRVHFHIPLHARPSSGFADTSDHVLGAMDWLATDPNGCKHIEMETYTWEVLPEEMRSAGVEDQLVKEYDWTLAELAKRDLYSPVS